MLKPTKTQGERQPHAPAFEPIESYERLIELRRTSPDSFMLQTSEATRNALAYYERARGECPEMSGNVRPTPQRVDETSGANKKL